MRRSRRAAWRATCSRSRRRGRATRTCPSRPRFRPAEQPDHGESGEDGHGGGGPVDPEPGEPVDEHQPGAHDGVGGPGGHGAGEGGEQRPGDGERGDADGGAGAQRRPVEPCGGPGGGVAAGAGRRQLHLYVHVFRGGLGHGVGDDGGDGLGQEQQRGGAVRPGDVQRGGGAEPDQPDGEHPRFPVLDAGGAAPDRVLHRGQRRGFGHGQRRQPDGRPGGLDAGRRHAHERAFNPGAVHRGRLQLDFHLRLHRGRGAVAHGLHGRGPRPGRQQLPVRDSVGHQRRLRRGEHLSDFHQQLLAVPHPHRPDHGERGPAHDRGAGRGQQQRACGRDQRDRFGGHDPGRRRRNHGERSASPDSDGPGAGSDGLLHLHLQLQRHGRGGLQRLGGEPGCEFRSDPVLADGDRAGAAGVGGVLDRAVADGGRVRGADLHPGGDGGQQRPGHGERGGPEPALQAGDRPRSRTRP